MLFCKAHGRARGLRHARGGVVGSEVALNGMAAAVEFQPDAISL